MAQANKQVKAKQQPAQQPAQVNTNAPIGLQTNSGLPVAFTAPANGMAAMAHAIVSNTAPQASTGRNIGYVQFVNGWPNGTPVANMQPLTINGALFNGQVAHTNPVAKAYAAGKPQTTTVPAFANSNQLVKLGKKAPPNTSPNVTNAAFGTAVNAAFAASNDTPLTLGVLAQACANAGGNAAMPNVLPWLVTHAYKRSGWLVNA
jgi:hypothetical protein